MLNMDVSNLWNGIALPDLLSWERQTANAQRRLQDGLQERFSDWMWQKETVPVGELDRIRAAARRIRGCADTLVVVGADEAILGIRGILELLRGELHNQSPVKPQIYFTGGDLSSRDFRQLLSLLDERDFCVNFITYAGTTMESALAYRALKWKLTERYGESGAQARIFVTTEQEEGRLFHRMEEQGITVFDTPRQVCGRFSVLSAVGLLPLCVAGLDPAELLEGASELSPQLRLSSFENPAWLYCAGRRLLWDKGRSVELLAGCENRMTAFGDWWRHLFADYPGPMTVSAVYPRDARLADGRQDVFETYLCFAPPEDPVPVESQWDDTDSLGWLEGRSLADVEDAALQGLLEDHLDRGVPAFQLLCGDLDAQLAGELLHFFEFSAALFATLVGEDPFGARKAPKYRRNMLRNLGAPGNC
ncbi:MAG: hypothetical protein VB055_01110 [Oscillospiraceae bacterium]|nr:hypothetical protein [Oscillospiraceae bacterium]